MTVLFYPILSLVLVILQTTLVPEIRCFTHCFDLLIVNVLYVSLFTSNGFLVLYMVVLGWIMDSLSGAPFGFYISCYVWIYVFVQILRHVIHAGNFIFIPVISVIAIFMEHGFLMFILLVKQEGWSFSSMDLFSMGKQAMVGVFIIPFFLWLVHGCKIGWDKKIRRLSGEKMGIRRGR